MDNKRKQLVGLLRCKPQFLSICAKHLFSASVWLVSIRKDLQGHCRSLGMLINQTDAENRCFMQGNP